MHALPRPRRGIMKWLALGGHCLPWASRASAGPKEWLSQEWDPFFCADTDYVPPWAKMDSCVYVLDVLEDVATVTAPGTGQ